MNPMIENVTKPPKILVSISPVATTIVSLTAQNKIRLERLIIPAKALNIQ
jgi:hypothetical protein